MIRRLCSFAQRSRIWRGVPWASVECITWLDSGHSHGCPPQAADKFHGPPGQSPWVPCATSACSFWFRIWRAFALNSRCRARGSSLNSRWSRAMCAWRSAMLRPRGGGCSWTKTCQAHVWEPLAADNPDVGRQRLCLPAWGNDPHHCCTAWSKTAATCTIPSPAMEFLACEFLVCVDRCAKTLSTNVLVGTHRVNMVDMNWTISSSKRSDGSAQSWWRNGRPT